MRVLGIDCGSRYVKFALMEEGKIIYTHQMNTLAFYRDHCHFNGQMTLNLKGVVPHDYNQIYTTGYGRNHTVFENCSPLNELKAHAWGAMLSSQLKDFVLLDVGGQDVKVIRVEKGLLTDLNLNEKCAASCGRYLENMASLLEVDLDHMCSHYKDPIALNSTCAVFTESELIGQIAQGVDLNRLYAGVNYALYQRLKPMLSQFKAHRLLLSGGVSLNRALVYYLKNDYDQVVALDKASYIGAMGAAYYGYQTSLSIEETYV